MAGASKRSPFTKEQQKKGAAKGGKKSKPYSKKAKPSSKKKKRGGKKKGKK